jgi:FkbM family methyltransferase
VRQLPETTILKHYQISMSLKHEFRKVLWKLGYDVARFDPLTNSVARRKKLMKTYMIDTVLDVGANTGQFAKELRADLGFSGNIISFEPLSSAYKKLKNNAHGDPKWKTINCGLGHQDDMQTINISANSYSSSLLKMLPVHVSSAPESRYVGSESIQIRALDSIFGELCEPDQKSFYLKVDTQGFEKQVLKGAEKSLASIDTIQLELSLVSLYQEGPLFDELWALLKNKGYTLVSVEPAFCDFKTGQLLQIDGVFHRRMCCKSYW